MNGHKLKMYARFERFWHWLQALLIIVLLYTGFVLHGTLPLMPFGAAHEVHLTAGIALLVLTAFAVFWHATTGQWRQYVPTAAGFPRVVRHYLVGIFRGEPHPFHKVPEAKLNPLQRLAYLSLKVALLPLVLVTGALLYGAPWLQARGFAVPFGGTAILHTAAAFAMLAFLIIHSYLTTTGGTVWSYTKAMITGWEEVDH
ncbi:MAG: cytochrome b/b6 domain-containing protein [Deltaproteobacteria bacterium]|nr:cytochrome b/b6 domain-containing protein [Candidatus Anaeroferrophillacea bacterium]